jgi:hypothetical protein
MTSIATDKDGAIVGYCFRIDSQIESGSAEEAQAASLMSIDILHSAIRAQFGERAAVGTRYIASEQDIAPAEDVPAPAAADRDAAASRNLPLPIADMPEPPAPMSAPEPALAPARGMPATPEEARARFFARYGMVVGAQRDYDFSAVRRYLNDGHLGQPRTVEEWLDLARVMREAIDRIEGDAADRRAAVAAAQDHARQQPVPARSETKIDTAAKARGRRKSAA